MKHLVWFLAYSLLTLYSAHSPPCLPLPLSPLPHSLPPRPSQVLYEQFKFFLNLYFLLVALTQTIPQLRINQWYTYWGPLVSTCTGHTHPPATPFIPSCHASFSGVCAHCDIAEGGI